MHLFINTISAVVIRRINDPKTLAVHVTRDQSLNARSRPQLSPHDEEDAAQTCALALLRVGLPEPTKLGIATTEKIATLCPLFKGSRCERASYTTTARTIGLVRWKAVFRAVRCALRIDRRVREDATDFAVSPEVAVTIEHPTISNERRNALARKVRYAHSLLHTARETDESRKRRSTFHRHLRTLRAFTAIWSGSFAQHPICDGTSESDVRVILHRFRQYIDRGEANATFAALKNIPTGPRNRELRAFAQIPEHFAVCRQIVKRTLPHGNRDRSCGCQRNKGPLNGRYRDGRTKDPLYWVWVSMHQRCENPRDEFFAAYGGRGIHVCQEWADFLPFRLWAANKWVPRLTLDRRDNDGPYCPDNCLFTTNQLNCQHSRNCKINLAIAREVVTQIRARVSNRAISDGLDVSIHIVRDIRRRRCWLNAWD